MQNCVIIFIEVILGGFIMAKAKKVEINNSNFYDIDKIKNTIITGDSIEELKKIPDQSIDLIFADPPYFMQTLFVITVYIIS